MEPPSDIYLDAVDAGNPSDTTFHKPIVMANMSKEEQALLMGTMNNFSQHDLQLHQIAGWRNFLVTLYAIIIIVGFLGNFAVVYVIIRNRHLHTVTNIFIANLAISDIFLCIFNLPFGLHYQLTGKWIFGEVLCHIIISTFVVPMYISTMLILMIAIDRYILIVFPFRKKMTKKMAIVIVLFLTLITLGLAIPLAMYTKLLVDDFPEINLHITLCIEQWPSKEKRLAFAFSAFALQFCLPLVVSTIMYTHIYIVLKRRPMKKNDNSRNQRTNKILVAIIVVFVTCWLPFNIFNIILDTNKNLVSGTYFTFMDLLFRLFAVLSACINPFLYGWLNDNFRKEISMMVCRATKAVTSSSRQNGNTSCIDPSMNLYTQVKTNRTLHDRPTKSAFV